MDESRYAPGRLATMLAVPWQEGGWQAVDRILHSDVQYVLHRRKFPPADADAAPGWWVGVSGWVSGRVEGLECDDAR